MRLGAYDCYLQNGSNTYNAYKNNNISERHRHRFEFNNKYKNDLESAGLVATGINKKNNLVEVIEIPSHPWFVGVQFHPEFKSTVDNPHPLFCGFIEACIKKK
jgi:CTP synthase